MASPFSIFRKYQKIMMASVGIMAMIAFVFIPTWGGGTSGPRGSNEPVVTWKYGTIRDSDLFHMQQNARLINNFVRLAIVEASGTPEIALQIPDQVQTDEQTVVRTMVLAKKAEELGIKVDDQAVNEFIRRLTYNMATADKLDSALTKLRTGDGRRVSNAQLFDAFRPFIQANNLQQMAVGGLYSDSPAARWDNYNRLNRVVKAQVLPVPAADFLAQVPAPSDEEINTFFQAHREQLPEPVLIEGVQLESPEPGFKIPFKAEFQYMVGNRAEVARHLLAKNEFTDEQLRQHYEANRYKYVILPEPEPVAPATPAEPANTEPALTPEAMPAEEKPAEAEAAPAETPAAPAAPEPATTEAPAEKPAPSPEAPAESPAEPAPAPEAPVVEEESATEEPAPATEEPAPQPEAPATEPAAEENLFALASFLAADTAEAAAPEVAAPETSVTEASATAAPSDAADAPPEVAAEAAETEAVEVDVIETPAPTSTPGSEAMVTPFSQFGVSTTLGPEYRPFEDVLEDVRQSLAETQAGEHIEAAFREVRSVIGSYNDRLARWSIDSENEPGLAKPAAPDFEKLAQQHGLSFVATTGLISSADAVELDNFPSDMFFMQQAFHEDMNNFQPIVTSDVNDNQFLVWKINQAASRVPNLDEVRDVVVQTWKMQQAREPALKAAEAQAAKARQAAAEPLAQQFGETVVEIGPFTTATTGLVPTMMMPQQQIRMTEIPALDNVGPEFMNAINNLELNQVAVAWNNPKTVAYVIQLAEVGEDLDIARRSFVARVATDYNSLQAVGNPAKLEAITAWFKSLEDEVDLKWSRPPQLNPEI